MFLWGQLSRSPSCLASMSPRMNVQQEIAPQGITATALVHAAPELEALPIGASELTVRPLEDDYLLKVARGSNPKREATAKS